MEQVAIPGGWSFVIFLTRALTQAVHKSEAVPMTAMANVSNHARRSVRKLIVAALLLATVSWVWASPPTAARKPDKAPCGDYGTAIEFEPTPKDAARRAAAEEKLVMVLHVSGHFEDPGLT
jgi:hypothetical protein